MGETMMTTTTAVRNGEPTEKTCDSNSIPSLSGEQDSASVDDSAGGPASAGNRIYKYHDYGSVEEDEDLAHLAASSGNSTDGEDLPPGINPPVPNRTTSSSSNAESSSIRVQKFPVKLYAILAQKEFHDIITWMPHGRSWKVLKPSMFESLVMPLFFEYSNYHSFNRLVNAWSFRRISSGPDRGSYYHELFLRGKPHLQKYMRRLPKTHKKLPMKKGDEPDFYKMDQRCPLPALEDAPIPGIGADNSNGAPIPTSFVIKHQQQADRHALLSAAAGSREPHIITPPHMFDMSTRHNGVSAGSSFMQMSQQPHQSNHYQQLLYNNGLAETNHGLQQLQQQQFSSAYDEFNDNGSNLVQQSRLVSSNQGFGRVSMAAPLRQSATSPMLLMQGSNHSPVQHHLSTVDNIMDSAPSDYFSYSRQSSFPQQVNNAPYPSFQQQQMRLYDQQQQQQQLYLPSHNNSMGGPPNMPSLPHHHGNNYHDYTNSNDFCAGMMMPQQQARTSTVAASQHYRI